MIRPSTISLVALAVTLMGGPLGAQSQTECSKERAARGDPSQIAACRARTARAPDDAEAYDALGIALANANDFTGAIAAWKQFARLQPAEFTGHHNLGLMYEMTRSPAAALEAFQRALPLATDATSLQTTVWHIGVVVREPRS